jgi:basic membrane lipoprotein Med (substrate-binding protein (PBP1-ABC) superfamily)
VTNKTATFFLNVIGGDCPFEGPATAKRLALVLNEQGTDKIVQSGGQSIQGVHEAAEKSSGVFVSPGLDSDQRLLRPASIVVTAPIYEGNVVYRAVKAKRDGAWEAGNYLLGINDGG